jgi:hypothetical protein
MGEETKWALRVVTATIRANDSTEKRGGREGEANKHQNNQTDPRRFGGKATPD